MNLDEMIAVMQGAKEGKRIEVQSQENPLQEWNWIKDCQPSWNWDEYIYRIAPEPKKRLIRVEELPEPCWLRWGGGSVVSKLVTARGENRVWTSFDRGDEGFTIEELYARVGARFSDSCKGPWKSFEVEE